MSIKQQRRTGATAIYVRVSSREQAERRNGATGLTEEREQETSLDTQLAACRKFAFDRGYVLDEAHIYREVHTGVELWERPKLAELREVVRRRELEHVVAYAIDRLSRDPVHLGVILSEAEHAGTSVEFVTEPIDNRLRVSSSDLCAATRQKSNTKNCASASSAADWHARERAS